MQTIMTKHGIPTATLALAVAFLNDADATTVTAFNAEFGLTPSRNDATAVARFAADAVLRGADTIGKVSGYVFKRMTGVVTAPAPIIIVAAPVVQTEDVTIVEVETLDAAPVVTLRGKRGRKKNGKSEFCKAVKVIQDSPATASRRLLLDCMVAAGIKEQSAVVYLWRYKTKGERE